MPAPRLRSVLALAVLALAVGPSGSAGPGPQPGASALAFAVKVAVPGRPDVSTPVVSAPPAAAPRAPGEPAVSPRHLTRPGLARRAGRQKRLLPLKVTPKLGPGVYVFPVYGRVSWGDTYGARRSDIADGWHHGDDIFGRLGQPVVAVASGTVFSVGWNKLGGNRLWLRDRHGNQFYYAHLAAYSTAAADGAHVRAGQVLGFMGNTGDAEGTPYHLHFEIHPVSLLYRHYDGAVDPTTYLDRWRRLARISLPSASAWVPTVRHGGATAPEPGAMLLQVTDVSQAAALTPASLRRALARPPQP